MLPAEGDGKMPEGVDIPADDNAPAPPPQLNEDDIIDEKLPLLEKGEILSAVPEEGE